MKFLDQAKVYVRSGDGGAGCVSFRREKFIEFGGPDGGDGGRGGDVVVECAKGLNTLIDFRYQQHFKAKTGVHGMGKNRAGGRGADVVLKVPAGTRAGQQLRLAKRGLPKPGGGEGDLFAIVQIVVPTVVNENERTLYEQLAERSTFNPRGHFAQETES